MTSDSGNIGVVPAGGALPEALADELVLTGPRARRPSAIRAWHAAAGACVVGIALVVVAASRAEAPASSPIDPPRHWGLWLTVGVALGFAGYVAALSALRRQAASVGAVLLVACVVQLVPLAGPTLLSTDAWTYWMYGRVAAVHGGDPYGDPPSAFPGDVAYSAMGSSWRDTTSLYGPLFTLGAEAHGRVAGDDPGRAAWLYRAFAALAVLGTAALAGSLATRAAFAVAFVGWNPLLALHFGGGGHNDAAMMLLVVGALVLAARSRPNLAGIAWTAAIGVKWVAAAFLGLWLLDRARRREPLGLAGLATGALAIAAVATARYGTTWLGALDGLSSQARRTGSIGLSKWLADVGLGHRAILVTIGLATGALAIAAVATARYGTTWLGALDGLSSQARRTGSIGLSKWLADVGLGHRAILVTIGLAGVVAFAWLAVSAWRGRRRLGVSGSVVALGQGWLNPWYASWGVSLSASEDDRLAWLLAVGLTGFLLLDVVPR